MENNFRRVENIDEIIKSVKLPYNAWKVLFLVDEDMDPPEIGKLLEEDEQVVREALERLISENLVESVTEETEELVEPAPDETTEEDIREIAEETASEEQEAEGAAEVVIEESEPQEESSEAIAQEPEALETVDEQLAQSTADEGFDIPDLQPDESVEESLDAELEELADSLDSAFSEQDEQLQEEIIDLPEETAEETLADEIASEAEEEPALEAPAPTEPKEDDTGKKTILIIDDSIVIRKMIEIALEGEGLVLQSAVSGRDGLDKIDSIKPNLVILDLMLPDINGIDILKTVKASLSIPVIMLSGKDSPQMVEKAKNAGADAFLPKPFKDEDLKEKIKSMLAI